MFEADFYLALVNGEYSNALKKGLAVADLTSSHSRILVRLEKHFEAHLLKGETFNHYRPGPLFR